AEIVLEDRSGRPCIAGADEGEVARRDLESGHIASATRAENLPLEREERARRIAGGDRAALDLVGPEAPGRMEHVDMRQLAADPFQPVKEVSRLEHRGVERFSVEADERAGPRELLAYGRQHRSLVGKSRQHELPRHERIVAELAAPDQKRVRPGTTDQTRRLEIDEEK